MKQALKVINEIKADYKAINNSKSKYLIRDKMKHIKRLKHELREYCNDDIVIYTGYNRSEVQEKLNFLQQMKIG